MRATRTRAVLATLMGVVLATLYAFSFVFAQATPEPHELPIAVAGPAARTAQLEQRIERAAGESYDVRRTTPAQARDALRDGDIYLAVVAGDGPLRFETAAALGRGATQRAVMSLPKLLGLPATQMPEVGEIRPLVGEDSEGQALNLQLFPMIILGVVVPILLLVLAPALTVRQRLGFVAAFAVLGGIGVALVVNVALDAIPGNLWAIAGVLALLAFGVGAITVGFNGAVGPAGVSLSLLLFLIVGNVASGASVQHELLPGFYRVVGPYLSPGAAADAERSIAYFDGHALGRPILVLGGFALAGIALCLTFGGRRPAGQGDPSGPTPDQTAVAGAR